MSARICALVCTKTSVLCETFTAHIPTLPVHPLAPINPTHPCPPLESTHDINHYKQIHRAILSVPDDVQPTPVAVLRAPQGSVSAEAEVLLKLGRHPHLVRFFGQCHDGDDELLLTELAPIGSLTDLMQVTHINTHAVVKLAFAASF